MHELSIVLGIIDIAEQETKKAKAQKVDKIELEIGDLAGVEIDALEFAWSSAVKNTSLASAKRKIHHVPALAKCLDCNNHFTLNSNYDSCPECGSYFRDIIQGKELRVKSLIVS